MLSLSHDLVNGRAVTAIPHIPNSTPMDWYSKSQSMVETTTFSSEIVAAQTAVDQIIDLRTTLRYLVVPIRGESYMFGDDRS